jgi:bacterioferritin (cytochrome b1)
VLSAASIDVAGMLTPLLLSEYQQRDLYEHYSYLLFGPEGIAVQDHLREHMNDEMSHIETLQRYMVSYGCQMPTQRLPVPTAANVSLSTILAKDLEHEKSAVANYATAVRALEEAGDEFIALRVDLENILSQEQEHVHDLERWLGTTNAG